ncbi:hypothetical protein LTR17_004828 [Elasticomyces elasticus]|nr:hypothetical protein LTR17_004828 [Elasticomyces elasticus]
MAGLTSSSRLQDPEFFDYSRSHRAVPVPPRTSTSKRRSPSQHYTTEEEREGEALERSSSRSWKRDRLLHRVSHSNLLSKPPYQSFEAVQNYHAQSVSSTNISEPEPGTRLGESDLTPSFPAPPTAGNHNQNNHPLQRNFSKKAPAPAATRTMLRKFSSSGRQDARNALQQQQNQSQTQHQQHTPRAPPPQLPTFYDYDNDNARPDSFGIFGSQTPSAPPSSALPSPPSATQAQANLNFSRPSGAAFTMSMSQGIGRENSSSSPAYVARTGNAFATQQQSSSSPSSAGLGGGGGGESMAHRGRMSYAGTNNSQTGIHGHGSTGGVGGGGGGVVSPRRIRRRKDPTPFNILVIGAKNSGKTSFISFLQHSFSLPSNQTTGTNHNTNSHASPTPSSSHIHTTAPKSTSASFTPTFLESEIDGERIGLTLWDSAGLEKHIIDLQLREISTFVEQKFEETFVEEQKVNRAPGVKDTHIHCVLLVLDPVRLDGTITGTAGSVGGGMKGGEGKEGLMVEGLDEDMDLQVLRALWGKTTVIPVISKGDTVTTGHMSFLKRAVWRSVKGAKLDPLEALELDDEEDEEEDEDEDEEAGDEGAIAEEDDEESDVVGNGRGGGRDGEDGSSASDSSPDLPTAKIVKRGTNGHARQSSLANAGVAANGGGGPTMIMEEEPYIPFSVLSPDTDSYPTQHHSLHNQNTPIHPNNGMASKVKVGRHFPWGFADPNDPLHCDFVRLRDSVFSEWRSDLRDLARTKWYENWRTSRLKNLPGTGRQRVSGRGGITPVAVVPKEGRSRVSTAAGGYGGGAGGLGAENSVPRSVSSGGGTGVGSEGGRTGKAERMMGISSAQEGQQGGSVSVGRASGGMMRGVESYQ